jgi:hypothetical protein
LRGWPSQTVHLWHANVHEDEVRLQEAVKLYSATAAAGDPYILPAMRPRVRDP